VLWDHQQKPGVEPVAPEAPGAEDSSSYKHHHKHHGKGESGDAYIKVREECLAHEPLRTIPSGSNRRRGLCDSLGIPNRSFGEHRICNSNPWACPVHSATLTAICNRLALTAPLVHVPPHPAVCTQEHVRLHPVVSLLLAPENRDKLGPVAAGGSPEGNEGREGSRKGGVCAIA